MLRTERLVLREPRESDAPALLAILQKPAVSKWWTDFDEDDVRELVRKRDDLTVLVIELDRIIGAIQFSEESDPQYKHAGIDLFLDPREHGNGFGPEAIRAVVRHLMDTLGHHRIVIDPAKENVAARRAYEKVGFRVVGVLRSYERDEHGVFRDGVLMELVRAEPKTRGARAEVSVRDATEDDPILGLMVDLNREEHIQFDPANAPVSKLMADPELGRIFVFEASGEIAGYAAVTYGFDLEFGGRDAFLTELYVTPAFRNRGIARSALERVFEIVKRAGASTIHLQVRPDNPAAIELYRGMGFETSLRMFMSKCL